MWHQKDAPSKYSALKEDDESSTDSLLEDEAEKIDDSVGPVRRRRCSYMNIWILHGILLFISASMLAASTWKISNPRYCIEKLSPYSPGLSNFRDVDKVYCFDVGYHSKSKFKGPPSPERDAAWDRITHVGAMSISEETRQRINASDGSVRLPEESGGGYMAMTEFVHEMHCIDRLWKHTYPEYYQDEYNHTVREPEDWHEHAGKWLSHILFDGISRAIL
ncbi:hypothetical protein ACMFMG_009833 [Clarireedia jacksonii]